MRSGKACVLCRFFFSIRLYIIQILTCFEKRGGNDGATNQKCGKSVNYER